MLLKGSKGTHLCFKIYIQQSRFLTAEWRVCDKFVLAELLLTERKTFSVWQVSWSLRDRTGTGESSNKLSQSWEVALGWSSSVFASLCESIPECVCERDVLPRALFVYAYDTCPLWRGIKQTSTYLSYRCLTLYSEWREAKGKWVTPTVARHREYKWGDLQQHLLWERCSHAHWAGKPWKLRHHSDETKNNTRDNKATQPRITKNIKSYLDMMKE